MQTIVAQAGLLSRNELRDALCRAKAMYGGFVFSESRGWAWSRFVLHCNPQMTTVLRRLLLDLDVEHM